MGGHSHGHHHHASGQKNLLISIILNFIITFAQIIGGIISNSLSLISDALHNLGDASALLIAFLADNISKRKATNERTFGFKRIEILAALFNAVVLIAICIYLVYEAYLRFIEPEPIKGAIMFIVATIGLIANLISVFLLQKDKEHNLNIKAAYMHLLGDTFSSFAVIVGGIAIYIFEIWWIDPLITFGISIYIIVHTFHILTEIINILMHKVPEGVDINKIKDKIESLPGISNIHHVHVWSLTDSNIHFESHVELENDCRLSDTYLFYEKIDDILSTSFGIKHTTIQFEYNGCSNNSLLAH